MMVMPAPSRGRCVGALVVEQVPLSLFHGFEQLACFSDTVLQLKLQLTEQPLLLF